MLVAQNNFHLATEEALDPEMEDSISESTVVIKDIFGWELYWRTRRGLFLLGFQEYVDVLIKVDHKVSPDIYQKVNASD